MRKWQNKGSLTVSAGLEVVDTEAGFQGCCYLYHYKYPSEVIIKISFFSENYEMWN